jgi:hypothetical protein
MDLELKATGFASRLGPQGTSLAPDIADIVARPGRIQLNKALLYKVTPEWRFRRWKTQITASILCEAPIRFFDASRYLASKRRRAGVGEPSAPEPTCIDAHPSVDIRESTRTLVGAAFRSGGDRSAGVGALLGR